MTDELKPLENKLREYFENHGVIISDDLGSDADGFWFNVIGIIREHISTANTRPPEMQGVEELAKRLLESESFPDEDISGEYQVGLHCGVEDRGCCDRYDGADYGYAQGVEACAEWLKNELDSVRITEEER